MLLGCRKPGLNFPAVFVYGSVIQGVFSAWVSVYQEFHGLWKGFPSQSRWMVCAPNLLMFVTIDLFVYLHLL